MLSEGVTLILRGFAPDEQPVEERPTEHLEARVGSSHMTARWQPAAPSAREKKRGTHDDDPRNPDRHRRGHDWQAAGRSAFCLVTRE
jgi:hypothetical protein